MTSIKSHASLVIQCEAIRGHLKVIRGQYNTFTTAVEGSQLPSHPAASHSGSSSDMSTMVESTPHFLWGEMPPSITTSLPFLVKIQICDESKKPMSDYSGSIRITAVTTTVCLAEGFEHHSLGLWYGLRSLPLCSP